MSVSDPGREEKVPAGKGKGKVCVFLSMANQQLQAFECPDDLLACQPLQALGWSVRFVAWRHHAQVDWDAVDVVVIRSTWDYQNDVDKFLEALGSIDSSAAKLLNPLPLVRWNSSKHYLRALHNKGVPIVPTEWSDAWQGTSGTESKLLGYFEQWDTSQVVIKPVVSASAHDTYRVRRSSTGQLHLGGAQLSKVFAQRKHMVQPFVPAIVTEGEYSLFYFGAAADCRFSHCILKRPRAGDFRVQEEHGGKNTLVAKPQQALLKLAEQVLAALPYQPLYARIDCVKLGDGNGTHYAVMEVELIEPCLYLATDKPRAAANFARAIDDWWAAETL